MGTSEDWEREFVPPTKHLLALERKSMPDAIRSVTADRARFIASCARLGQLRWKAIVIEATYEDMKTPYDDMGGLETDAHPNGVVGTLDAIEAKFGIPICTRHGLALWQRSARRAGYQSTSRTGGWKSTVGGAC